MASKSHGIARTIPIRFSLGSPQIQPTLFQWNFTPKWFRQGGHSFTLIFTGTGQVTNDSWNTVDGAFIISP